MPSTLAATDTAAPPVPSSALLTDRYELTMADAALTSGVAERRAVFELFTRRLPTGHRYGVVAGLGRVLDELAAFTFHPDELAWLAADGAISDALASRLDGWRFSGDIRAYPEGELHLAYSPVMQVEACFLDAVLLETLLLSILNHDAAIAAAASRMVAAADGRPLIEMGSRRTHERAAVAAARAAYVAGFAATSNLAAGRRYQLPTVGTAAHAFTLAHPDEAAAFRAQLATHGTGTTLLVDTYDTPTGIRTAVEVAREFGATGPAAIRIDSGHLPTEARAARTLLDGLGATDTAIVVSSDLDEHTIAQLAAAPVDRYGVGTRLVSTPPAGFVYKLVEIDDEHGVAVPVAKRSASKATCGGRKWAYRQLDGQGHATAELVTTAPLAPDATLRELLVDVVVDGVPVAHDDLAAARHRHATALAELPAAPLAAPGADALPALPTLLDDQILVPNLPTDRSAR